jgi:hypothetical protein
MGNGEDGKVRIIIPPSTCGAFEGGNYHCGAYFYGARVKYLRRILVEAGVIGFRPSHGAVRLDRFWRTSGLTS